MRYTLVCTLRMIWIYGNNYMTLEIIIIVNLFLYNRSYKELDLWAHTFICFSISLAIQRNNERRNCASACLGVIGGPFKWPWFVWKGGVHMSLFLVSCPLFYFIAHNTWWAYCTRTCINYSVWENILDLKAILVLKWRKHNMGSKIWKTLQSYRPYSCTILNNYATACNFRNLFLDVFNCQI